MKIYAYRKRHTVCTENICFVNLYVFTIQRHLCRLVHYCMVMLTMSQIFSAKEVTEHVTRIRDILSNSTCDWEKRVEAVTCQHRYLWVYWARKQIFKVDSVHRHFCCDDCQFYVIFLVCICGSNNCLFWCYISNYRYRLRFL